MLVSAKDRVIYKFRDSGKLLNLKTGDTVNLTPDEIYNMGSMFYRFFVVKPSKESEVELFNDDPELLFQEWKERNLK